MKQGKKEFDYMYLYRHLEDDKTCQWTLAAIEVPLSVAEHMVLPSRKLARYVVKVVKKNYNVVNGERIFQFRNAAFGMASDLKTNEERLRTGKCGFLFGNCTKPCQRCGSK